MSQETISSGRSRRARKKVDYSMEQQFSDDDIFEDEPRDEPKKKGGRSRKSNVGTHSGGGGYLDRGMSFERSKVSNGVVALGLIRLFFVGSFIIDG